VNILYAGTLPPHPGGTAVACSQVLLGLAEMGHAVRSIAPITPEALEAGDSFALSAPQLGVRRYAVPHFEVHPIEAPAWYRELEGRRLARLFAELVAEERPDVVFVGRPSVAWHIPRLAAAQELPCVVRAGGSHWVDLLRGDYGRGPAREYLAEIRHAALVVTPARHLAEGLEALGIEAVSISNAVDSERFRPRARNRELAGSLGISDGAVVLVHASNLKPLKRPLDIVKPAERVLASEREIVYLVLGEGSCRAETEAACTDIGIDGQFRFAGWVDHHEMPDYLNLADIAVVPSESEGQSNACLEAQASGLALLASDIPGAREIVVDGETGCPVRRRRRRRPCRRDAALGAATAPAESAWCAGPPSGRNTPLAGHRHPCLRGDPARVAEGHFRRAGHDVGVGSVRASHANLDEVPDPPAEASGPPAPAPIRAVQGSFALEQPVYGISDLDIVIVVLGDTEERRRVQQRWARLCRRTPSGAKHVTST
jgi:glycosyltransferase involved in cell wall biosynthesis